jgi:hypothetical membrane protein
MSGESQVRWMTGPVSRWPLLCGAVALPLLLIITFFIALFTPGYSHLSDTVSHLGRDSSYAGVMNAGFIAYGLLVIVFAWGLYRQLGRSRTAGVVWLSLGVAGLGVLLVGIFRVDPESAGETTSLEGTLHAVFSQVIFIGLLVWMIAFARAVYLDRAWAGFAQVSVAAAAVSVILSLIYRLDVSETLEGLVERAFFGLPLILLEVVSLRALWLAKAMVMPAPPVARRQGTSPDSGGPSAGR